MTKIGGISNQKIKERWFIYCILTSYSVFKNQQPDSSVFQSLPKTGECQIIGKQLLRSGTSVAANYRSCCRARSKAEFIAKLCIVIEEADESLFWMELLTESKIVKPEKLQDLQNEAMELLSIFSTARKTITKKSKETQP